VASYYPAGLQGTVASSKNLPKRVVVASGQNHPERILIIGSFKPTFKPLDV
jgi:hypothetical protein